MINEKLTLASMRQAFGDTLVELGSQIPELYVVSMDLRESMRLTKFAKKFRSRFIECGVAENNAASIAAGLAKSGKTVFLASFACFSPGVNWSAIRESICYNNLNVKIVGGYSGLMTGVLGATHQMLEDVALMRSLPNMEVFAPIDATETSKIIKTIARTKTPSYIRIVGAETPQIFPVKHPFTVGKSQIIQSGSDVTILGYGPILTTAFSLKIEDCKLEIINCSSIKPLDSQTILKSVKKTGRCLVIEDHQKIGGLGEAVASLLLSHNIKSKFTHLGVDNQFGQSSRDVSTLYHHYGLDINAIKLAIKKIL
ncbi:transketolase family protein [Candidatus Shapirobacteria bacterium]|nr:transketolase family protein [Candidatus Shapirobacteria bacterium]